MEHTEAEITQTSLEEAEIVLLEQEMVGCENKSDAKNEGEQAASNSSKCRSEKGNKDTKCSEESTGCNGDLEHSSDKDTNSKWKGYLLIF